MKKLLLASILLVVLAPMAMAQGGVNINWGAGCWNDGTQLTNKTFNCATNSGSDVMTMSFAISSDQPGFLGIELTLEGKVEAASVPAWFQMDAGECRAAALSASEDFTSAPQVGCVDPWGNQALGGVAGYFDQVTTVWPGNGPDQIHVLLAYALNADTPSPLTAGTEYYAAKMTMTHAKTVGTGLCAGCSTKMIWGFYSLKAASLGFAEMLYEPLGGQVPVGVGNQCLTWQTSTIPCNKPVPTRNTTWGQVKSLYR